MCNKTFFLRSYSAEEREKALRVRLEPKFRGGERTSGVSGP